MALQRTRRPRIRSGRSLRSLGSPLNARLLGGRKPLHILLTILVIAGCHPVAQADHATVVTVENRSTEVLDRVNLRWQDAAGHQTRQMTLGRIEPGKSGRTRVKLDRPEQLVVEIWTGRCPAPLAGPFLASGMDYLAVISSRRSDVSVVADEECHTVFTMRGSFRVQPAA
jgi:hypothetical protein